MLFLLSVSGHYVPQCHIKDSLLWFIKDNCHYVFILGIILAAIICQIDVDWQI